MKYGKQQRGGNKYVTSSNVVCVDTVSTFIKLSGGGFQEVKVTWRWWLLKSSRVTRIRMKVSNMYIKISM